LEHVYISTKRRLQMLVLLRTNAGEYGNVCYETLGRLCASQQHLL